MIDLITQTVNKIEDLLKAQLPESKYQFELHDLATNTKHFRGLDEPFHWGSVYKLFVVAEVFKMAENGELNLSREIALNKRFDKGVGFVRFLQDLNKLSIRDCCKILISTSDNFCADMLTEIVGIERLNKLFEQANCKGSKITDNLYSIVSLIFSDEHNYSDVEYIHSKLFYERFEKRLIVLLERNYTNVKDLNSLLHFLLTDYLKDKKAFLKLIEVPNVHSRFAQYMGFNNRFKFIGKTGTLGLGVVSNESAIIYDLKTEEVLGYISVLTKNNRKRIYESFDVLALIAVEIGKLYEKIYELNVKTLKK